MTKLIVDFLSFANAPKQDAVQLVWQAVAASLILRRLQKASLTRRCLSVKLHCVVFQRPVISFDTVFVQAASS